MARPISPRALTILAFLAFVSLGLPDTLLGVAWPSIRDSFGRHTSDLGLMLGSGALGYLASSFLGGEILRRHGMARLLIGSTVLVGVALAGIALSPFWPALIVLSFVSGLSAGAIDAGINTFAAARFSPRVVNWLHACWGIGASVSPLLMTAVIQGGRSWRVGYAAIAGFMVIMFLLFVRSRDLWRVDAAEADQATGGAARSATIGEALRQPVVLAQMLFYFVYAGVEVGAGVWLYTLLREGRGEAHAIAGTVVGGYWAALTVGRIVFGQVAAHLSHLAVIRTGLIGSVIAIVLIWLPLPRGLGFAGILLLGFMLAPIFPTVISDTPLRVGAYFAPQAIGFQVSGAAVGIATLPGVIGLIAQRSGIGVLPICLLALAIALLALHEVIVLAASARARSAAPATA
jgi:fucose permease